MPKVVKVKPRTVCTCISNLCGSRTYLDERENVWLKGQLVDPRTAKRHQLADKEAGHLPATPANDHLDPENADVPLNPETDPAEPPSGPVLEDSGLIASDETRTGDSWASVVEALSNSLGATRLASLAEDSNKERAKVYDDSQCRVISKFQATPPVFTYAILVTAILTIIHPSSNLTSGWLLQRQVDLIELTLRQGPTGSSTSKTLDTTDIDALAKFPKSIQSVFKWLCIDPVVVHFNCCSRCFATYPAELAPDLCQHQHEVLNDSSESDETNSDTEMAPENGSGVCGEPLFRMRNGSKAPVRHIGFQLLTAWLARFFSRKGIEDLLDLSIPEKNSSISVSDIHGSKIWKEFQGPDGSPFTARSGNIVFGLFIDGINPYGNKVSGKHASITFVVLVCLSLPFSVRFLPQNIYLVGIAPGPKEPSLTQTNWILNPVVQQLRELWSPGIYLSSTARHPKGRHIFAALIPVFADLPALRRAIGFAGHSSNLNMCSLCELSKDNIKNLVASTWIARSSETYLMWAHASRDAATFKERKEIFEEHGIRYSVLTELPYWKPVEFHCVDAMHNLLLGLIKWHCVRFWAMSSKISNPVDHYDRPIPANEVSKITKEKIRHEKMEKEKAKRGQKSRKETESAAVPATQEPVNPDIPTAVNSFNVDQNEPTNPAIAGVPFRDLPYGSQTSPDDFNFAVPDDWDGIWEEPATECIFDSHMLNQINEILPRLNLPSWIDGAVPVLGKASYGKLKADEWRTVFLIQLPLILAKIWNGHDRVHVSLLRNFGHLVSAVNTALKRSMTEERIALYNQHINQYLKSALILFPDSPLAPNHHLSMHLGDCLARFGPVRAWWSFPMERLMGQILTSTHNNHIGELEITFLEHFCRLGNLRALLEYPEDLPESLRPFIPKLKQLYDPPVVAPRKTQNVALSDSLTNNEAEKLVNLLNAKEGPERWALPSLWVRMGSAEQSRTTPLPSRCHSHKHFYHQGVTFSTWIANGKNSVVLLKSELPIQLRFARIESIFTHQRPIPDGKDIIETWLMVKPFPPLPQADDNPFNRLKDFEMQATVRLPVDVDNEGHLINIQDVVAHCAWVEYKSGELAPNLKTPTVAMVSVDRE